MRDGLLILIALAAMVAAVGGHPGVGLVLFVIAICVELGGDRG
ncbi:hypothetical protein [Pseudomonas tohonis]|nr:hypothetical protein [Pseudomonas tohonis]